MAYDTLTGNVLWQQQGDSLRRVHFAYHATGSHRGLLARVRYPHPTTGAAGGGGADSVGYDLLGNLPCTHPGARWLSWGILLDSGHLHAFY